MPRLESIAKPLLVAACITWAGSTTPRAQSTDWSDRAFFNVNLSLQLTARPFDEHLLPIIYTERASIGVPHPDDGGRLTLDVAGGLHVWKNFGVGGTITKFAATDTLTVNARIPNPMLLNQQRAASKAAPFNRGESAIHIHALYMIPVTPRIDVAVSAGPSLLDVQQDLVQGIEVAEAGPPFTSVAIGDVALLTRDVRGLGMHAGVDVTWFLTPLAGVGITARYVRGSVATRLGDGTPLDLDVGGFQVGAGARLRLR